MINREKLKKISSCQSHMLSFWDMFFAQPMSLIVAYPFADLKWATPNFFTTLSMLVHFLGLYLIYLGKDYYIAAGIIIQFSMIFDNLDGTIARYRNIGSTLGGFYDKISDMIKFFFLFMLVGWIAYNENDQNIIYLLLGTGSAYTLLLMGYSKWVVEYNKLKSGLFETDPNKKPRKVIILEKRKGFKGWMIWFVHAISNVYKFDEPDLFFWLLLALIFNRLDILCYVYFIGQFLNYIYDNGNRISSLLKIDRNNRLKK